MTWPTVKLGDICEIYAGGGAPQLEGDFCDDGIPFIRAGSLPKLLNGIQECQLEKINALTANQCRLKLYKKDAIVFAKSGMSATKGHIYRLKNSCYIVNHLAILKPLDACCPNYLEHALKKYSPTSLILDPAYPSIRLSDIASFKLPLPPLAEQQRIAAILDKAELVKRKRELVIEKLDVLTQSIFIEMFGDPQLNQKGFETKRLGDLIKFEGGSQPDASNFLKDDGPENIRFVQIRDFRTDKFKTYIPKKLAKRFFNNDDVMIGRYGPPVFQILRGLSGSYNVALIKAVPRDGVIKDFIYYLLKEKKLHNFVVGNSERTSGQSGVNLELLEKYQAYLPPIELQNKFSLILKNIEKLKLNLQSSSDNIKNLSTSLQSNAFSGQL